MGKIVILTTGQPATNPRMIKEVTALLSAGYEVKVYYSFWTGWAKSLEKEATKDFPPNTFTEVGGNPFTSKGSYLISRIVYKAAGKLFRFFPGLFNYATGRNTRALMRAAAREKAGLYIAHNLGALPAASMAAKKWKAACGFDAEDYHRGEYTSASDPGYGVTVRAEETFIPLCDYLTAASPLIAEAYQQVFPARKISVINNVFSNRYRQLVPERKTGGPMSLFWFSQSVGPDRGLEQVIEALNALPECEISLQILGDCPLDFRETLTRGSHRPGQLHFLDPVAETKIFQLAAGFDIGLASEIPHCENRDICLTNKLFTYLLAGNAILTSNTRAQENFLSGHPGIGQVYRNGDAADLADKLRQWYNDREGLFNCRHKSWELSGELNWEKESVQFLSIIRSVFEK